MTSSVVHDARALLSVPQRQSLIAVVFLIIRAVRGLGIGTIVVGALFVFNAPLPGGTLAVVPIVVLLALGVGVLSWWRFTFMVEGDELRVTRGILQVERLSVPLDRVQSVSIEQELLHRPVGLVRASVDTAGSSEAEFSIDAVDRSVAEALQVLAAEYVSKSTTPGDDEAGVPADGQPPPPVVPEEVIFQHSPSRLVRIAVAQSPWAGLALFAPLLAVADDLRGVLGDMIGVDVPDLIDEDVEIGFSVLWVVAVLLVVGTVLSVALQVIRELTTNWQLTLTRTPTGFRRTAGLFSTSTKSSSFSRIQQVASNQTPVQRWFGIRNVRLPTIGSGDLILPGLVDDELARIRRLVLADDERIPDPSRRISPLAIFLAVRNSLIIASLGALALASPLGWWACSTFLLVPISWLRERRRVRLYRWDINESAIVERAELYTRSIKELALRKAQSVTVSQSFFERRRGLATVKLRTAEGSLSVGMIPLAEAKAVRDRTIFRVETDHRRWM